MVLFDYMAQIGDGFEFLLAMGSLIGLLGIMAGFAVLLFGSVFNRRSAVNILIVSFILVGVCGLYTGIKYFRLGIRI